MMTVATIFNNLTNKQTLVLSVLCSIFWPSNVDCGTKWTTILVIL